MTITDAQEDWRGTHTLSEAAGAASLAAALKIRERLAGQTVALVLSGGNITVEQLRTALAEGARKT